MIFLFPGHLVVIHSPDREQRDKYTIKIRAVQTPNVNEREVPVFFYTLYVKENEKDIIGKRCFKRRNSMEIILYFTQLFSEFIIFFNQLHLFR